MVRRHRLAERFLTDMLGLSWADAHHEAGKWEHVMSDERRDGDGPLLGSPTTCPHGNPIPGQTISSPTPSALISTIGESFTVNRITEELEFTPGLLDFLEESSSNRAVGADRSVARRNLTVEIDGHHVGVGAFASVRILVSV